MLLLVLPLIPDQYTTLVILGPFGSLLGYLYYVHPGTPTIAQIRAASNDQLIVSNSPFSVVFKRTQEKLLSSDFDGQVTLVYRGHFGERIGIGEASHPSFGTNNCLTIEDKRGRFDYYIFLATCNDEQQFTDLARILTTNAISVVEYKRGKRVYFGEQLNYQEIQKFKSKYHQ